MWNILTSLIIKIFLFLYKKFPQKIQNAKGGVSNFQVHTMSTQWQRCLLGSVTNNLIERDKGQPHISSDKYLLYF